MYVVGRVILSLIISVIMAMNIYKNQNDDTDEDKQRYTPFYGNATLPFVMVGVIAVLLILGNDGEFSRNFSTIIWIIFSVFIQISIYYLILMPLLPLFRKYFSAKACAYLWILPNMLYVLLYNFMRINKPLLIISAPRNIVYILAATWFVGFLFMMSFYIISHLLYRHKILKNSYLVKDTDILDILQNEIEYAGIENPKFKLVYSPNVNTPLSIGIIKRKTRIVLPEKSYTYEELHLIFRHELVHICREDSSSKFFFAFCKSLCWFNPLVYFALRKSAEDLELSCDEAVLEESDQETKYKYADLILRTAGDERGFTTCLSSSAKSMKYRLSNIVNPPKKFKGGIIVGLMCFAMIISCGYVTLAYSGQTGKEAIFNNYDSSSFILEDISDSDKEFNYIYSCKDEKALFDYISSLPMNLLATEVDYSDSEKHGLHLRYKTPDGIAFLYISDKVVNFIPLYDGAHKYYYIPEKIDFEYLYTIIEKYPALKIEYMDENDTYPDIVNASLAELKDENNKLIYQLTITDTPSGRYGSYAPIKMKLEFSHPLVSDVTVQVVPWKSELEDLNWRENIETSKTYTLKKDDLTLDLDGKPAHHIITGNLQNNDGTVYKAVFLYDIGDMEHNYNFPEE